MNRGPEFFDMDEVFEGHTARRYRADSPNETLEKPVFLELLGEIAGQRILDLGCGDGRYALELLQAGAKGYVGLEPAEKMVVLARQHLAGTTGQVVLTKMEDWHYPAAQFELVISRLALHYVADLDLLFQKVNRALGPAGRFVFSVVHPLITSCDRSRAGGGKRYDWIVDNYFVPGSRQVFFMGQFVEQFHRTIEDIFGALQQANFAVEQLRESRPVAENFEDEALYARRRRIPLFLFMVGRKMGTQ